MSLAEEPNPLPPARGWRELFSSLALALFIALGVGYALLGLRMEKSRQDLAWSRLDLYMDEMALQLENGLRFGVPLADIGAGARIAGAILEKDKDVRLIVVLDDKGAPVMRAGDAQLMPLAVGPAGASRSEHWVARRPLKDVIAAAAGEVRVVYSSRALHAELEKQFEELVRWIAMLALVGLLLLAVLSRWIVGRIGDTLQELETVLDQSEAQLREDPRFARLGLAVTELERIEAASGGRA